MPWVCSGKSGRPPHTHGAGTGTQRTLRHRWLGGRWGKFDIAILYACAGRAPPPWQLFPQTRMGRATTGKHMSTPISGFICGLNDLRVAIRSGCFIEPAQQQTVLQKLQLRSLCQFHIHASTITSQRDNRKAVTLQLCTIQRFNDSTIQRRSTL